MIKRSNPFGTIAAPKVPQSSVNLSHTKRLTTDMGYLIPTVLIDCVPGDKFHDIGNEILTRMSALVSPVMDQVYIDTDWFFVPHRTC